MSNLCRAAESTRQAQDDWSKYSPPGCGGEKVYQHLREQGVAVSHRQVRQAVGVSSMSAYRLRWMELHPASGGGSERCPKLVAIA